MAEVEHDIKTLPIDANLETAVKKLEAEGWELMPGITPVAIYHVVRMKGGSRPMVGQSGFGTLGVDDTKVHILRDGKLLDS